MQQKLNVMELERFAIHDGPGIRTVVFLQGCPLHCPWCCNPESQRMVKQLLYTAQNCVGCGACAAACTHGAITLQNSRPLFARERCVACGDCAAVCLADAIRFAGEAWTVEEIVARVLRDRDYYEESGGGVTVSGGEPFVQFEGLLELLHRLQTEGLHTAVETTGQVEPARLAEAEPLLDLFLFDLKHADAQELRRVTGGNLPLIVSNLRFLAAKAPEKVVVRVPVIPGFNDEEPVLDAIFALAAELGIKQLRLLPYHKLGSGKYARLGRPDPMWPAEAIAPQDLEPAAARARALGLTVGIGG